MVRGGESSASLQLTPVDLGPMDVNVTVRDGQASGEKWVLAGEKR